MVDGEARDLLAAEGVGDERGAGDVDIIVAVESQSTWCVTLAMVRGGRHLGDRSFFPSNASGSDACTIVVVIDKYSRRIEERKDGIESSAGRHRAE